MPKRPPDHPPALDEHEMSVFAAELGTCVSIDLHGLNVHDTLLELDAFIQHAFMTRTEVIKIIHGRGEQKLKAAIEKSLASNNIVEYFRGSHAPSQAGAVTYAIISRKPSSL